MFIVSRFRRLCSGRRRPADRPARPGWWILIALVIALAGCSAGSAAVSQDEAVADLDDSDFVPPTVTALPEATATGEPTVTGTAAPPTATATATATATPAATATPEVLSAGPFRFRGTGVTNAVIGRGASGGWDATYVNPGAVIYHDGQFHMFRNAFFAWPGLINVGYATSSDGFQWHVGAEPVFRSNQIPYVVQGADVSAGYVGDDGTWVLYFHTLDSPSVIGRATAPAPRGPWTPDPEPVLGPGGSDAWDSRGVRWPSVVQTDDGLVMYYGATHQFTTLIGRAISQDGISWTKYDDPETGEPPFAESDPVLRAEEPWTSGDVDRPEARLTDEGWTMLYVGNDLNKRGLAFSDDGIHWDAHEANPVFTGEAFPINGTTWDTALIHQDETYYYYMEIGSGAGTDIYVATHKGSLRP